MTCCSSIIPTLLTHTCTLTPYTHIPNTPHCAPFPSAGRETCTGHIWSCVCCVLHHFLYYHHHLYCYPSVCRQQVLIIPYNDIISIDVDTVCVESIYRLSTMTFSECHCYLCTDACGLCTHFYKTRFCVIHCIPVILIFIPPFCQSFLIMCISEV